MAYSLEKLQQAPLGETNMSLVPVHRACSVGNNIMSQSEPTINQAVSNFRLTDSLGPSFGILQVERMSRLKGRTRGGGFVATRQIDEDRWLRESAEECFEASWIRRQSGCSLGHDCSNINLVWVYEWGYTCGELIRW